MVLLYIPVFVLFLSLKIASSFIIKDRLMLERKNFKLKKVQINKNQESFFCFIFIEIITFFRSMLYFYIMFSYPLLYFSYMFCFYVNEDAFQRKIKIKLFVFLFKISIYFHLIPFLRYRC